MFYVRLGSVLLLISLVACGLLAFVNAKTAPQIQKNKEIAEAEARNAVIAPEGVTPDKVKFNFEQVNNADFPYFVVKDDQGTLVGYTFLARQRGYSSVIATMVGVKPDFSINNIQVIDQAETPGLGDYCKRADADYNFPARFTGLKVDQLKVDKDGGTIQSITGATITTRAITKSIQEGLAKLKATLEAETPNNPCETDSTAVDSTEVTQ